MPLTYKTFFEVKLLHEYFLTREDGSSLFSEVDPAARITLLQDAFQLDQENIQRDLRFAFPPEWEDTYRGLGLVLVPSYAGARVLIRVVPELHADGSITYRPFYSLPADLAVFVAAYRRNGLPDTYSSVLLSAAFPAMFLFSNTEIGAARVFPYLANPPGPIEAGYVYEQGEMALDGNNVLQQFFYDIGGIRQSRPVAGNVGVFASEKDRMLLSLRFPFRITHSVPVTQLQVSLKDTGGAEVAGFSLTGAPLRRIVLDFRAQAAKLNLSKTLRLPDGQFSLELTGNDGFSFMRNVVFSEALAASGAWALMHVAVAPPDTAFRLLGADGRLIAHRDNAGHWTAAPVFQIPFKSRYAYFRFRNVHGRELALIPTLNQFLFKEDRMLITQLPVSLSRNYFSVLSPGGVSPRYLPNPDGYRVGQDNNNRIWFDVPVHESDLFPTLP